MDKRASEWMGESVLAGVRLEAPSVTLAALSGSEDEVDLRSAIQGAAGAFAGQQVVGLQVKGASLPGGVEGVYYVAVGPSKVAFFSLQQGLLRGSLQSLLVEHPRGEVRAMEIKAGFMPSAHWIFADGTYYALMCARTDRAKLEKVREVLRGG